MNRVPGDSHWLSAQIIHLREAVRGADIGLWDCDSGGDGLWFDDWCQRHLIDPCDGPDRDLRWRAQVHPDDLYNYRTSDQECLLGRSDQYVVEYRIRTQEGRWRWLQERGTVSARAADGRPQHYFGVCLDIDERKAAELIFRRSDERFRSLARLSQGYVFEGRLLADRPVEFTWADDDFAKIFGCDRHEVNRRGWQSFVDPRDRGAAAKALGAVAEGATVNVELRIIGASGERRWLRMAGEPMPDPETGAITGIFGMGEDITDRKVLTEQMFASIRAEQHRIGSDLHDELGQVLTGVSLLLRGLHTSATRGFAVTPAEIDGALDLVTGAIETTRKLAHGLAPGSLDAGGLKLAIENLASQARRWFGLEVIWSSAPDDLRNLDPTTLDHLYRIVQESITNVVKHAKAARAEISTRMHAGVLSIEVSDDGTGIANRITSGFGHRTMRYRAEAIGAEFTIDSIVPHGTRVSVRLPMHSAAAAKSNP